MSSEGLLLADCRGEEVSLLSFLLSPLLLLLEEGGAVTLGGGDGTVGGSSPVRYDSVSRPLKRRSTNTVVSEKKYENMIKVVSDLLQYRLSFIK